MVIHIHYIYNYFSSLISDQFQVTTDAIKRIYVRYFSSKKLQEEASLCPHEKLPICIATGIKTNKDQPQKLCLFVAYTSL